MTAYYNEFDPYASQWLKNLSDAGHIAKGRVDSRSILEVTGEDVGAATQAHFFAGIGVWSHALRLAGWPDDRPVWTGSCPCQPFSVAGRGKGTADEHHLWPAWFKLIDQCRPPVVFGEQVASPDGLAWLDAVCADLEGAGYAVGAADLCAAGVGAPHIRQRLYFVGIARDGLGHADSEHAGRDTGASHRAETGPRLRGGGDEPGASSAVGQRMGEPNHEGLEGYRRSLNEHDEARREDAQRLGATSGFWSNPDWVACRDGKQRPVEPGSFPLAHGAAAQLGRLRAFGNAIVSEVAATFIKAVMQSLDNANR